jgi:hypothetical protein
MQKKNSKIRKKVYGKAAVGRFHLFCPNPVRLKNTLIRGGVVTVGDNSVSLFHLLYPNQIMLENTLIRRGVVHYFKATLLQLYHLEVGVGLGPLSEADEIREREGHHIKRGVEAPDKRFADSHGH